MLTTLRERLAADALASDPLLEDMRRLGAITGGLHAALASDAADPAFAPEPITREDVARWAADIRRDVEAAGILAPADAAAEGIARTARALETLVGTVKIRSHGDYHLGQVLKTEDGFAVIDFEGEPARPLPSCKRSPLRDVAGTRFFAYAASASGLLRGVEAPEGWEQEAGSSSSTGTTVDSGLLPPGQGAAERLSIFELEKAADELRYELNNRPDWVKIPVAGMNRACWRPRHMIAADDAERRGAPPCRPARRAGRAPGAGRRGDTRLPPGRRRGGPARGRRGDRARAGPSRGLFEATAPRCPSATGSRSPIPTAASLRSRIPTRSPPPSPTWTCISPARAATRRSTAGWGPTRARSRASPAPPSRCGRPPRGGRLQLLQRRLGAHAMGASGIWSSSCPASSRAPATSTRSSRRTRTCLKADPYAFEVEAPPGTTSMVHAGRRGVDGAVQAGEPHGGADVGHEVHPGVVAQLAPGQPLAQLREGR